MVALSEMFDRSVLMGLAGPGPYGRGHSYQVGGRVEVGSTTADRVVAVVRGTMPYRVELWSAGGKPAWSCDCPAAEDGAFCKHCVAVAIEIAEPESPGLRLVPTGPAAAGVGEADLEAYVSGLDHDRLVELVLVNAHQDWRLRERLTAEALAAAGVGPPIEEWKERIHGAFEPFGDFVSYHEANEWAADVGRVIDSLSDLCEAGHADAVVTLTEIAHRCADAAIQYVDDSDGCLTEISSRLSDLHLVACAASFAKAAQPDPIGLARRLVDLELTSELDGFYRAAAVYAELLGEEGLAEYRRLLDSPAVNGEDDDERMRGRGFAVRQARIGWALGTGDPDVLIEVKQDDLALPDDFLEVSRMLAAAGRVDEAIDWAQRGLVEHADRTWQLRDLRDFLSELLRSQGNIDAAVELFWDVFAASPSLEAYRRLLAEGSDEAPVWRDRSIATLHEAVEAQRASPAPGGAQQLRRRPSDALIDVLMFEGDTEAAWVVARELGCERQKLLALARSREAEHPVDAIDVYEPEVFLAIEQKKNPAYAFAVDLMARIERLAVAADCPDRFFDVLDRARTEHRAKRNLKKLLDAKGWPDPRLP